MRVICNTFLAMIAVTFAGLAPAQSVLVSSGPTLNLVEVTDTGMTIVDSASIPTGDLLVIHQIFSVKQHPTNGLIYASSANPCYSGNVGCWGNGRVDKFELVNNQLSWVGAAYIMDDAAFQADGISCAQGDETSTGYPGQEGFCQPTNMVFSDDGSRLYIDDDELDGIEIFSVDPATGDLSFISEGASTSYHGLAYQGDRLYNGASVISVAGDTPSLVAAIEEGNATEILQDGTLVSTIYNQRLTAYDLADPDAPAVVDDLALGGGGALDTARTDDASLFVVSGREVLTSVGWDGATFTQLDQAATPAPGGGSSRANRGVALVEQGGNLLAIVAHFQAEDDADYGTNPTGAELWSVDPTTGAFSLVDSEPLGSGWSRTAVVVTGTAPPPPPQATSVPVNASWAIWVLIAMLLFVAGIRLRVG
ncbi:MAG: hypothetical protein U5L08_10090 [Xanthomonadales bacterium]|nr:hypothetical protein [Xanthomonadales bacterium]